MIKDTLHISLLCLFIINSLSAVMPFTSNKKDFYVGRFNVDIESSNQVLGSKIWKTNFPNFTYTLPVYYGYLKKHTFSNIYLGDFQFNNIGNGISCMLQLIEQIDDRYIFIVLTNNSQNIMKLAVNYILYFNYNVHSNSFYIKGNIISVKHSISKDPKTFYFTSAPLPANFSTQNVVVKTFFSGFEMKATNKSNNFDLSVTSIVDSKIGYKILISSNSLIPTYVQSVRILFIIFDPAIMQMNEINGTNKYRVFEGMMQNKILSKKFEIKVEQQANPTNFNTIVGLSAFSTINQSTFGFWNQVYDDKFTISVNSLTSLTHISLQYVIVQSRYCHYKTPYWDKINDVCYQQCPGLIESQQLLMCFCSIDGILTKDGSHCRRRLVAQEKDQDKSRKQMIQNSSFQVS